jgi:hypothetical protein
MYLSGVWTICPKSNQSLGREIFTFRVRKVGFNYQLEGLQLEIDLVDREITRMGTITQNVKNFSIVTWAGDITVFFGQDDLRKYIIFTAFLPLVFWSVDACGYIDTQALSCVFKKITNSLMVRTLLNLSNNNDL